MKRLILSLLIISYLSGCSSNERYLHGKVTESDGEHDLPMENVGIYIDGISQDITKKFGLYTLKIPDRIEPGEKIRINIDIDPKLKVILHPLNGEDRLPLNANDNINVVLIDPSLIPTKLSFRFISEVLDEDIDRKSLSADLDNMRSELYFLKIEKSYNLPQGFLQKK